MALDDKQEQELRAQLATETTKRTAAETAAEERRKSLETERAAHKTATDTLSAEHAKKLGEVEVERRGWATDRLLLERGFTDPTDRKVALLLHGELPEAGRPELGAWLDGLRADPTKVPRQLAHVLAAPGGGAAPPTPPAGGAPPKVPPAPPKAGETSAGANGKVTVEQIREAGQRARRPDATDADRQAYKEICARLDSERGSAR